MTVVTAICEAKFARSLLAVTVLVSASTIAAPEASAISSRTKLACLSDYRSYCSAHRVGTHELRQCMSANGPQLSKKCISALVAEGEISEAEVARRAASLR